MQGLAGSGRPLLFGFLVCDGIHDSVPETCRFSSSLKEGPFRDEYTLRNVTMPTFWNKNC
ncbi:MAG: hypothetical protein H6Q55_62 [Deltaproteobacteria bacterium]|nr:hypothetical protein [Deltaproteobacteria bacterium]